MVLRLNYNIGTHQCTNRSDSAMSIMMLSTGRFPCDKSGLIRSAFAAETDDRSSELSSASVCECILLAVFCCDIYMPDHAPCVYSTNGGGGRIRESKISFSLPVYFRGFNWKCFQTSLQNAIKIQFLFYHSYFTITTLLIFFFGKLSFQQTFYECCTNFMEDGFSCFKKCYL